jgi:hypothetical protein
MLSAKDTTFLKDLRLLSTPGDHFETKYGLPSGQPLPGTPLIHLVFAESITFNQLINYVLGKLIRTEIMRI